MSTAIRRKREKHTISIAEAMDYEFSHRAAGSHGERSNKTLDALVSAGPDGRGQVLWEVTDHRKSVLVTSDLREAVEAYNELP